MTITYSQIRDRIETTAEDIGSECAGLPKDATYESWTKFQDELETLKEEAYDKAHESVDSWDWCIYTYKGFQVYDALSSSEQSDAESLFADAGGHESFEGGPYELGCAMAYHWLVQELVGEIERQCEELLELVETKLEQLESE